MIRRLLILLAVLLVLVPIASAAQPQFSMSDIESELMCPTCQSRLDLSHSPAADRIRAFVEKKRMEGWTKQQVEDALVADFGPSVLAAPPASGIGLVAWVAPIALVAGGLVVAVALVFVWRRRRSTRRTQTPADTALDARVDTALREFDDGS
ncbi:MAG: cytochrome c-type biogenesis protein CcmH [Thermoleophilia bacterium]